MSELSLFHFVAEFRMPLQDNKVFWKCIGFGGLAMFNGRWITQWLHSERKKESVIPISFWWQSLIGAVLCLLYSLRQQDSVFIAAYALTVIPYTRNLMLIYRKQRMEQAARFEALPAAKHEAVAPVPEETAN
jgi:lipid-A-disaccharide synthase-like uncharacterized protein